MNPVFAPYKPLISQSHPSVRLQRLLGATQFLLCALLAVPGGWAQDVFQSQVKPFLDQSCLSCHNDGSKTAGVSFDEYTTEAEALAHPYVWEDVRRMIIRGTMPPQGLPQPERATVDAVVAWIDERLEEAAANVKPDPGRVTARRLNRTEYNNTIRDLLDVDFRPADDFPVDDSGYGFDNIGDVLTVSPVLMEKYLIASGRIARSVIVTDRTPPQATVTRITAPRARGDIVSIGSEIEVRYSPEGRLVTPFRFPATGEYEFALDFNDRRTVPPPRPEWMNRVDEIIAEAAKWDEDTINDRNVSGRLKIDRRSARIMLSRFGGKQVADDWVLSHDELMANLEETREFVASNPEREIPPPAQLPVVLSLDGKPILEMRAGNRDYADGAETVRVRVEAGERMLRAEFLDEQRRPWDPNALEWADYRREQDIGRRLLAIDNVEIRGPFDAEPAPLPESHLRLVECSPAGAAEQERCAKTILSKLARRAFRRPASPAEVDRLVGFVKLATDNGAPFEEGLQVALQALLVSPRFLFRIERDPEPGEDVRRIDDYELATRLSYFLWSSMPDDELLDAAGRGELRTHDGILAQVRRMLADGKARALAVNFAGQWLQLRNLARVNPDPDLFPEFDEELRRAMRTESELFFEAMLAGDRNILDFLTADFTFVNQRLAEHYGMEGVEGDEFRKVEVDGDRRGGLLSHAGVLTVSSYPTRTSPVLRGLWVLENILDSPPPPPPPGVQTFDEATVGKEASLREQLEQHRTNPSCAVCHERMDTLGLGLENYDPIGRWRTKAGEFPIDSTGELPGGHQFNSPIELKTILRDTEGDRFARALTEKLMTYALGRGLERFDTPAVRAIQRRLAAEEYRFSALIAGIVTSDPFLKRRGDTMENSDD